jgi:glyoxalase family protein
MISGIHHITLGCSDAARTVDFYTRVLGLRLVKKTVNFDDPTSYHLYFGDAAGSPGSVVTFFEWGDAPQGRPGVGGTHHFALRVADGAALRKWKRYLNDRGIKVNGPLDRNYFESIYLKDPDGSIIELATDGPGWAIDEAPDALGQGYREPPLEMVTHNRDRARIEADTHLEHVPEITPDMALARGLHHITAIASDIARTHDFLGGQLGLGLVKRTSNFDDPGSAHWYWGVDGGEPGTLITYFERDPKKEPKARTGVGQTHHYALSVADEDTLLSFREALLAAGQRASAVLDRVYFKSVYTRDPDGHVVELATAGPGFAVDEPPEALGSALMLPPWLEPERARLEPYLQPLAAPTWRDPSSPTRTEAP